MERQVIILGSGCAGSTAAIYAARANLSPLVLEGHEPGGQLTTTTLVENFPGFPEGVQGPELVERMKEQAKRFGAEYRMEHVAEVDFRRRPFTVTTTKGSYRSRTVIVATGASAKLLGLPEERQLMGRGVSTCATCDGAFYRDQEVVVVGGGDTALEDALFLTRFARRVTVVHRRDQFRASRIMADRALRNDRITVRWNAVVERIHDPSKGGVTGVTLRDVKTGVREELPVHGVFVAIGHDPNTAVFAGQLELDRNGYVVLGEGARTSVEGVFAAGDVHDPHYRQAVTAAGAGCRAAIEAERYLESAGG